MLDILDEAATLPHACSEEVSKQASLLSQCASDERIKAAHDIALELEQLIAKQHG